jgi:hypothetical protein
MKRILFSAAFMAALVFSPFTTFAACTSPAGAEGDFIYNDDYNKLAYCDDTAWIALHASGPGDGGCTAPSGAEGTIYYDADENVPQVCAGTMWMALGKPNAGAGGGGCSNPAGDEGTIVYNADAQKMQYCDGSAWKHLHGSISGVTDGCTTVGQVCADGTVYAGLSGASAAMFATPCDAGMTWNGSSCTGTRSELPWNNGNNSGYVETFQTGTTDGKTNTANLTGIDSDSVTGGTQPHQAAQYCADLTLNGHDDWYLPAQNELNTLYTGEAAIGNFNTSSNGYWSSSEASSTYTRRQRFSDGSWSTILKNYTYAVRCVRDETPDCPDIGDVCSDGTVYAGLSPDGNVKMYVTRCDVGMSWDGSSCTGTRSALPWNGGNTTGYVTTSQTSTVTGESNTGTLASMDSDSDTAGTQAHVAAKTCNDLSENGHTDWYLPAQDELNVLYTNKAAIGNFDTSGGFYWSSRESTSHYAARQRFSDGLQYTPNKEFTYAVRCARR